MQQVTDRRVRESGMPSRDVWELFFEVDGLLDAIGFVSKNRVIEFGAGYGVFTIPIARRSKSLTAIEVDSSLCRELEELTKKEAQPNVSVVEADFYAIGSLFPFGKFDAAVLFNIIHMEDPVGFLRLLTSIMEIGSEAFVLHWRTDIPTPRGPSLSIRSSPSDCRGWFRDAGFSFEGELFPKDAPYHFAQTYSFQ